MEVAIASRPSRRGARILLALGENATETRGLLAMLEDRGHHVDTMANGPAAVEAAKNCIYQLVIMATGLQELDTTQTSGAIRELPGDRGRMPIIAITSGHQADCEEACLAAGMDVCLAGPLGRQPLLEVLDQWLPDAAAAPQATLDNRQLEQLERDTSVAAMPRLLAAFRRETARRVGAINRLLSPLDLETLQREAHSLKSGAATFGATSLQQLAWRLELACRCTRS